MGLENVTYEFSRVKQTGEDGATCFSCCAKEEHFLACHCYRIYEIYGQAIYFCGMFGRRGLFMLLRGDRSSHSVPYSYSGPPNLILVKHYPKSMIRLEMYEIRVYK
jgi:hypothetical protein